MLLAGEVLSIELSVHDKESVAKGAKNASSGQANSILSEAQSEGLAQFKIKDDLSESKSRRRRNHLGVVDAKGADNTSTCRALTDNQGFLVGTK